MLGVGAKLSFVPSIYINTMGYFFTWGKVERVMVGGTVGRGCLLRGGMKMVQEMPLSSSDLSTDSGLSPACSMMSQLSVME